MVFAEFSLHLYRDIKIHKKQLPPVLPYESNNGGMISFFQLMNQRRCYEDKEESQESWVELHFYHNSWMYEQPWIIWHQVFKDAHNEIVVRRKSPASVGYTVLNHLNEMLQF